MRVLVVESCHDGRRAIVDALVPLEEIAVQGAVADLHSALQAIFEHRPEIVVTGVKAGDDSGLELIESARLAPKRPKIVVVGDMPTRDDWCRYLAAGADRCVARDQELTELRDVVGDLVRATPTSTDELALLGRLAAGVTHDLNNYLNVLALDLATLSKQPGDPELVGQAIESTDAMARLTHTLLQYVRGEAPPVQLVDLAVLVRGVVRMVQRSIPRHVTVELDLSEQTRRIPAVPAEIEQLVANLLLNAVDAMPDGGTVRIRCQPTTTDAVFFEIADEGDGVPGATTKPGRRLGLGLGIVKRVAERHQAALRVAPRQPKGTAVTLFFPTRRAS